MEKKQSADGQSIHTITDAQLKAFSDHINLNLQHEPQCKKHLPVNPKNVFSACSDGVIFCKLIKKASTGTIQDREINSGDNLNLFQKTENLNLAISSAKSIGCVVVGVNPQALLDLKQHIMLGMIWQVIRVHYVKHINFRDHPEILLLKKENEEVNDLLRLSPEEILLRWVNYHLAANKSKRVVKNLGKDLKDLEGYQAISAQAFGTPNDDFFKQNEIQRANKVLESCHKLNIKTFITPEEMAEGSMRLNIIQLAMMFNAKNGLILEESKKKEIHIEEDDPDTAREVRIFIAWINSLGIEGVFINSLFQDLKDGVVLLKIIERIKPKSVDWERVILNTTSKIKRIQNANYAVELCKELKLVVVAIGGIDIVDGKKLVLGLVWQLCKMETLQMIGDMTEDKLVEWGNSIVPQDVRIKSLKDKSLADCKFFLKILEHIEPRAVHMEQLSTDKTPEAIQQNCKYVITTARKLGATVIMVWEHIKEVNPKFLLTFLASLYQVSQTYKKK